MHDPNDFPTLGDWAYLAIARFHRQLRKEDQRLRTEFGAEEVHAIRGTCRRLRFILNAYAPAIRLPRRFDSSRLAEFSDAFGKLRDHDIMIETLARSDHHSIPSHERDAAAMLRVHIRHLRHRPLRRVVRMVEGKRYQRTIDLLGEWVADPLFEPTASIPILSAIPDLLLPHLSELWLHHGWFLTPTGIGSSKAERHREEQLHALRRRLRRVRYMIEAFQHFYPEPVERFVKDVIAMQDALGTIQDDTLLPEYVDEHFDRSLNATLPHFVQRDHETRRQALITWEQLRRRYLAPATRQAIRVELLKPAMPATMPKPYRKILDKVPPPYIDLRQR